LDRPQSLMSVPYSIRSRFERHPRTAMGWNEDYFYLVQVDGRQRDLSMGMTLAELSEFMLKQLRCTDALNLDGGGSSTFWADGSTRNNPCEGRERELANALLVVRKPGPAKAVSRPIPARGG
jgi:exopolysaccharide biosynthesis protein